MTAAFFVVVVMLCAGSGSSGCAVTQLPNHYATQERCDAATVTIAMADLHDTFRRAVCVPVPRND
ncbi:MAG: hypothetical protein ACREDH_15560 [Methylocella sp.]